jgi:hypothetical protein
VNTMIVAQSAISVLALFTIAFYGNRLSGQEVSYSLETLKGHKEAVWVLLTWIFVIMVPFIEFIVIPAKGRYYTPYNKAHYIFLAVFLFGVVGAIATGFVSAKTNSRDQKYHAAVVRWHHRFAHLTIFSWMAVAFFGVERMLYQ